ncbi:MAG: MMPL family transporter [Acidimicrobiales bacterium]|jgi:RND superfamily putative drug exporter
MSQNPSISSSPTVERRRRARLVLWLAGAIALLGLAGGALAFPHLTSSLSDYDAPGSAVVLAQHAIQEATGSNPEEGYEVVVRTPAAITESSPLPARVATVVALLRARPEVRKVLDYANTGDRTMISSNGQFTVVVATVGAVQEQKAVSALESAIAAHRSLKGDVWLGGPTVADVQIAAVSSQDLGRAELFVLPFLILLLFFVFRGWRAAAIPLIGALFAIAVTLGVMGLVILVLPLSVFALNLVIALGLGLAVDFSLLIVSRFREEYRRQGSIEEALATVRRTAGHTVLFSSITIAAAMATLAIFPERLVYSMGVAGAIVVLAAGAFALLVLPAILVRSGERIVNVRLHASETTEVTQAGRWYGVATGVMRRPAIWATSAVVVLVVLAVPFLHVSFTGASASSLPTSTSAGAAYQLVQTKFGAFSEAPAGLVINDSNVTTVALASYGAAVTAVPGVKAVSSFQHLGGSLWEANVALIDSPLSPAAQRTVEAVQSLAGPGQVTVIGQTASFLALQKSLKSHLPLVLGLIVLVALLMLVAMTRSLVLPLMAVAMNLFTIGAAFGVLVWAFQWGHLSHLLGFGTVGALQSTSLIIILAVVFGLSTDYGVFLLGRMKEEHEAGADPSEAIARGLEHTGGIVSTAACCLALAIGALVLSRLVFVKELGLGVAFAVILDATIVRGLLVPALMKLLGPASWWSPAWLARAGRRSAVPAVRRHPVIPGAVLANGGPSER